MKIDLIMPDKLEDYEHLILPVVYEELTERQQNSKEEGEEGEEDICFCLAAFEEPDDPQEGSDKPVSALVAELEYIGDINILSLFTLPEYRRKGYAQALVKKAVETARALFQWEDGEKEDEVILKTLYRLPPKMEEDYEGFLKAVGFTDFVLLDEDKLKVWSAHASLRFYRNRTE